MVPRAPQKAVAKFSAGTIALLRPFGRAWWYTSGTPLSAFAEFPSSSTGFLCQQCC
jgi:hypothetical protein